jgi:hypothetical protein
VYEETNTIWFSEHADEDETMYKLIGVRKL